MGWLITKGQTKKELIADRLTKSSNASASWNCLAHCMRGNVLWTVWRVVKADGETFKYIGCDLLRSDPGFGWGYKDLCESVHPYHYSCPLKYLDMVPVASEKWREGVRAHHAKHQGVTDYLRGLKIGDVVNLKAGCWPPVLILASKRPLRGTHFGQSYKIARKLVDA